MVLRGCKDTDVWHIVGCPPCIQEEASHEKAIQLVSVDKDMGTRHKAQRNGRVAFPVWPQEPGE